MLNGYPPEYAAIKQNESSDNNASLFIIYNFYKLTNIQYYAIIAIFA